MIPWMKEQIADVWNRKNSSRAGKKTSASTGSGSGSLSLSATNDSKNSDIKCNNKMMSLTAASTSSNTFNVTVISLEGDVLDVAAKPDFTVEKLKTIAIKFFYGPDSSKVSSNYHLIDAGRIRRLSDDSNLVEENIGADDELLMVQVRPVVKTKEITEETVKGPSVDSIVKATSHLSDPKPPRPTPTTDCPADFQAEIRKILITLVEASAKILMNSPEAATLYEIIRETLELRYKPPYDPKTVKYLTDIGFAEAKVLRALRICKMNVSEALEWLIEHQDDPDDYDNDDYSLLPSIQGDAESNNQAAGPSSGSPTGSGSKSGTGSKPGLGSGPGSSRRKSIKEACFDIIKGTKDSNKKETNLIYIVGLLLQSFHQYKQLEFRPNHKIKESLIEMGFQEKSVVEALKITGNNQFNACEWLLGVRNKNLHDVDQGLDADSPIYEAIMSNPHIQLSLTNPKMLLAYLSILETPSSTSIWINDPEVSPVLSQIFKTYHSEKHAIHMNRYENSDS
ncbi:ubiquitin-associated domain-containing protein 1 [Microplitis demolitor]|uniref:ubiquitin-associated domain-containing protein 1 n=1 Tax=Microplitis demolitor TaxID=69319 RepID=UPI0004CCAC29|nr:ubiquitin-associated domain-containing protein 1 [Microplitis demolitor]